MNPFGVPAAGKIGDDPQQARNRTHQHYTEFQTGNGSATLFFLQKTPANLTEVSQDTWIMFPWDTEPQFAKPIAGDGAS